MDRNGLTGPLKALAAIIVSLLIGGIVAVAVKGPAAPQALAPTPSPSASSATGSPSETASPTPIDSVTPTPTQSIDPSLEGPDGSFPPTGIGSGIAGIELIGSAVFLALWKRRESHRAR